MKIFVIIGTRPEAIKMIPVYRALCKLEDCKPVLVLTGQHREMVRDLLDLFEVTPDVDLDIMEPGQTLVNMSVRLTQGLAGMLGETDRPDAILVQGDTTSALIAGLLGFYAGCRVGHIEAGLRTGNLAAPYPEEFNRRVLSLASHWHFAPTAAAGANLRSEGILRNVYVVGNTVIDAALEIARRNTPRMQALSIRYPFLDDCSRHVILVTTHRRENFGIPMQGIAVAVSELAHLFPKNEFIVPVHPNPEVGIALRPVLEGRSNIHLMSPLNYDEMIYIIKKSYLILTDSGGIQEEAPAFGVPVLVLRNETERQEGVEAGCSKLIGTNSMTIVQAVTRLLTVPKFYNQMAQTNNPYGDGQASKYIATIIGDAR